MRLEAEGLGNRTVVPGRKDGTLVRVHVKDPLP